MKILAHRGYWKKEQERNTIAALAAAIEHGFGIETDIRDYKGELVVSHNIAEASSPKLRELFEMYHASKCSEWMALNIKADGLQPLLQELLEEFRIENYFLFDMSIPEMVVNKRQNLKFYTRHSDIENECVLYDDALGVWLDSFYTKDWPDKEIISSHLKNKKSVCIISPEIHGFDQYPMWDMLRENGFSKDDRVMLCTDLTELAKEFFDE